MKNEIWKDIPTYEGIYQVSNLGNVKSLNYNHTKKEMILNPSKGSTGYYQVGLCKNGKAKSLKVHQLVSMAFLEHTPCGYDLVVDHVNDDKLDNRVENLQIVTQRFNVFKTQVKYTSNYKGVSWYRYTQKWASKIRINGKGFHLGYFKCELAAHLAYQNKLKELSK